MIHLHAICERQFELSDKISIISRYPNRIFSCCKHRLLWLLLLVLPLHIGNYNNSFAMFDHHRSCVRVKYTVYIHDTKTLCLYA